MNTSTAGASTNNDREVETEGRRGQTEYFEQEEKGS
jgi:hypothetical protein